VWFGGVLEVIFGGMPESPVNELLSAAAEHQHAGRLREAEVLYRQILQGDPNFADALHGMGLLALQVNKPELGAAYLARAAQVAPGIAIYHYNQGEAWLMANELDQAVACLRRASALEPNRPEPHAALGITAARTRRFSEAADALAHAIQLGMDRAEIYQQLGNAQIQINRFAQAEQSAREALTRAPNSHESWQTLGEAQLHQDKLDEAAASFRKVLSLKPDYSIATQSLGITLAKAGSSDAAIETLRIAVRARPDSAEARSHLGSLLVNAGSVAEGIMLLEKSISLRPGHMDTLIELARAYEKSGQRDKAAGAFEQLQKLTPDNPNIAFHIAALRESSDAPAAPPQALMAALFDRHADTFDKHLLQDLGYRVPKLLHEAVMSVHKGPFDSALDLGCGTGLCGVVFRPDVRALIGVDLSPAMIEKARERNLYDKLDVADVLKSLQEWPSSFDLLLAGDVFCYLGDLSNIFASARSALRSDGLLAFSVELSKEAGWKLSPSRRYLHGEGYILDTATKTGLKIKSIQTQILRQDAGKDVAGLIVVASGE
jgi:predicted TPR repeat methyltransferase